MTPNEEIIQAAAEHGSLVLACVPNYVQYPGVVTITGPTPSGNTSVEDLRSPRAEIGLVTVGVSDQLDGYVLLDFSDARLTPRVTSLALSHDLSPDASFLMRGLGQVSPASMSDFVSLPTLETGRSAGTVGLFSDIKNGVDAATPNGVNLPSAGDWIEAQIADAAGGGGLPLRAPDSSCIRLRLRGTVEAHAPLDVELRRGAQILQTFAGSAWLPASSSSIYHLPFNPAEVAGPTVLSVRLTSQHQSQVTLEECDVIHERTLSGDPAVSNVYRSGWTSGKGAWTGLSRDLRALRPSFFPTHLHLVSAETDAEVTEGRYWEVRIRDGQNPEGRLYLGSVLAGSQIGSPQHQLNAAVPIYKVDEPRNKGRRKRAVRVEVKSEQVRKAFSEIWAGLALRSIPVVVSLWHGTTWSPLATFVSTLPGSTELSFEASDSPASLTATLEFKEV